MAKFRVPYFVWRSGRPRWEPGPSVRALGFRGLDLKGPDGNFLPEGAALDRARELNRNVEAVRATPGSSPGAGAAESRTVRALVKRYEASAAWKKLAPRTQRGYRQHLLIIEARFGARLVGAIVRDEIETFLDELVEQRGLATANAVMRTMRLLLYYARDALEWIERNRLTKFRMTMPEGRLVLWTPDEIAAFVSSAETLELEAQGDAAILALFTGQRRGDVLRLAPLVLEDGVYRVRQAKTGATAYVPSTRPLEQRLALLRARRKEKWPNVVFKTEIVSSRTGRAYDADGSQFGDEFREVRAHAATSCPSILEKRFADLRDTAVTWLLDAGCDEARVATITGHSLSTVRTILDKHYFVRHADSAKGAGVLLEAFLAKRGMG